MPYGGIGAYVYNQVNKISKCALGHKMCGLGIEMCALGPILACTYRSGPYGGIEAYVCNQVNITLFLNTNLPEALWWYRGLCLKPS